VPFWRRIGLFKSTEGKGEQRQKNTEKTAHAAEEENEKESAGVR